MEFLPVIVILLAALGTRFGDESMIGRFESDAPRVTAAQKVLSERGEQLFKYFGTQSAANGPYVTVLGQDRPCSGLFDAPLSFLFCRPQGTRYYFRPTFHRRQTLVLIVSLLFRSGIESNPGPVNHRGLQLNLGVINTQSIVKKAARIHDLITENHLDLLAVTETWVYEDSPEVHKREAAPSGYSVVHAHRKLAGAGGVKKCGRGALLSFTAAISK